MNIASSGMIFICLVFSVMLAVGSGSYADEGGDYQQASENMLIFQCLLSSA